MSPPGKPQPLTPPRSDRLEHQRLVSSNSASPYQRGLYEHENIPQLPQLPPHSHTTFSSPESHRGHIDPYEQGLYQYPTREEELHQDSIELQRDLGLDVNPNQYGAPTYYAASNGPYNYPIQPDFYPYPPYNSSSPLTPAASYQDVERRKRTTNSTTAPSKRPARAKKAGKHDEDTSSKYSKNKKKNQLEAPHLDAPLSELTKAFEHIPIKDTLAWVNRTSEERQAESEKRGSIPRSMNAFMLYRAAYAERCKAWSAVNNHQLVSKVCGKSWKHETPAIDKLYREYANIDKANHASAFPNYKFQPSKAAAMGKGQKRKKSDEEEDEPSDLDDPDFGVQPSAARKGKGKARASGPVSTFPVNGRPMKEGENGLERSNFYYNNPGRDAPPPLGSHDLRGHYYEQVIRPNAQGQDNIEDIIVRTAEAPSRKPPVVAIPGANHYELLHGQSLIEAPLDPVLSQYNGNYNDGPTDFQNLEEFSHTGYSFDDDPQNIALPVEGYPNHADSYQLDPDTLEFAQTENGTGDSQVTFDEWMKVTNNR